MLHTAFITFILCFAISSVVQANGRQPTFLELDFKQQQLQELDGKISLDEYKKIYHRNQKYARSALSAYSKHVLGMVGMPEKMINLIGASVVSISNGAKFELNQSKTFAIEFKDIGNDDRTLYFSLNVDW